MVQSAVSEKMCRDGDESSAKDKKMDAEVWG